MRLLLLISTIFLATPSQAITWNQFWRPFNNGSGVYFYNNNYYNGYTNAKCFRDVYREEYIPGNGWSYGYVRRWTERVRVPCYH